MWDMKPNAPAEVRGEFKPIGTSLPGVQFGEHLPKMARHMHRCTLVRSAHHSVNNAHAAAVYTGLTGHDRGKVFPCMDPGFSTPSYRYAEIVGSAVYQITSFSGDLT